MMTIDRNGLRPWCGAALLVSLAACGGGDDDGLRPTEDDRDGDGLSNVEEAYLGSNPDAADTDRDGWNDGDEVEQNTDPLNGFDHPYTGGWAIAPCRGDLQGNGNGVGNVAYNFSLMDQHGEPVRLHDFCDRSIVLASGAEWCEPCIREATFLANKFNEYRDDGLMVITLLGEDVYNVTPAQSNLETWADTFDISHPVLQDTSFSVTATYTGGNAASLPANQLIGPGGVIRATNLMEVTEEDIRSLLGL